jgi:hypothetical protein
MTSDRLGALQRDILRVRIYQLQPEPFEELRGWLDEVEAFWADQLQSFKTHAERKNRARAVQRGRGGRRG